MASINPFQHADDEPLGGVGVDDSIAGDAARSRRARKQSRVGSRRSGRLKEREAALRDSVKHGWPEWDGIKPVILFLLFPGILGILVTMTGPWPQFILYGLAALMGAYILSSAFRGVELVLAVFLLYLPFSTTFVIPIAPGINGTNMLMLLGFMASIFRALDEKEAWWQWPAGTTTVFMFGFISCLSAFTILRQPGGWSYFVHGELLNFKAWIDQFFFYFICLTCIRSPHVAKRVVIYMCIGSVLLVIYAIPEMIDKSGRGSIDKSRIGGPHRQPNMFGGFVAYTLLPIIALFITYMKDIKAWLITPYFLIAIKVLIATFSRGAYLAIAVGALMAGYFRGKGFLFIWLTLSVSTLLVFPQLFPESIKARLFGAEKRVVASEKKLDKSSEHRLILWRAGAKMIIESPILGKGFKGFKKLKSQYTEHPVNESDPHNTYLYIAAQMGLPALVLFLFLLGYAFFLGRALSQHREDMFVRAMGVGGASMTVCYAAICMFGSRAVNLEFSAYFWAYFVCMQVTYRAMRQATMPEKQKRRSAFTVAREEQDRLLLESDTHVVADAVTMRQRSLGKRASTAPSKTRKSQEDYTPDFAQLRKGRGRKPKPKPKIPR